MKSTSSLVARAFAMALLLITGCASQKLVIESTPSGGTVYINDKKMGTTPLSVNYNELPYDDNISLRIEKQNFSPVTAFVQGPKQAGIGEKVQVKLSKAPDEAAELNAQLDRIMAAHKLALEHHYIEAERLVDQMIADHADLIAPRLLKGAILMMAKNLEEAKQQYQGVLELDPANSEATKMLTYLSTQSIGGAQPTQTRLPATENQKEQ
jgi:tetratricopeptide (TPR) repeat protein